MKLLTIATTLLATTSATIVYPYTSTSCSGNTIGKITSCGCTNMSANYNVRSIKLNYQKATATFYKEKGCKGPKVSKASDQSCLNDLPWATIGSVDIHGGTC